jgi:hypothetical protein
MIEPDTPIPVVAFHRGVGLHEHQDPERLALVRAEVDQVLELQGDVRALFDWVEWRPHSSESRLLAAALIRANCEAASERRRSAPPVDLQLLDCLIAGLGTVQGRSRFDYDSRYRTRDDPAGSNRPVRRPQPLEASATRPRLIPSAKD